jgi:RimJ/RimL family protein N-acetyltransferase
VALQGVHAFEDVATARLQLRRPVLEDVDEVFRIHHDPRTYRFGPRAPVADRATSEQRVTAWIAHWEAHGFGYWTAVDRQRNAIVGVTGLTGERWLSTEILNLYYRFDPAVWRRGLAGEAARIAVALGRRVFPERPILARTTPENVPSQRTALAAGLVRREELDAETDAGRLIVFALGWPAPG